MKKAFSLIELLIVILIIGIVYTLSVGNFKKIKDETKKLTLQHLKEYLQEFPCENGVELICLDDCQDCEVFVDGEKVKKIDTFLNKDIKIYRYDFYTGMQEQSKKVYFNSEGTEEDICFSYAVDKKGIGDQLIVEFDEKVYDFSVYLSLTPIYDSLEEVVDFKENQAMEILR